MTVAADVEASGRRAAMRAGRPARRRRDAPRSSTASPSSSAGCTRWCMRRARWCARSTLSRGGAGGVPRAPRAGGHGLLRRRATCRPAPARPRGGSIVAVTSAGGRRHPARDALVGRDRRAPSRRWCGRWRSRRGASACGPTASGRGCSPTAWPSACASRVTSTTPRSTRRARNIPMRTFGTAVDLAEAVCFLASPRARYVTGQVHRRRRRLRGLRSTVVVLQRHRVRRDVHLGLVCGDLDGPGSAVELLPQLAPALGHNP